jgi:hypothetical protein
MERDELRFVQDMAYLQSLEEDNRKRNRPIESKPVKPEPTKPEPVEPDVKLTLQELRDHRIKMFSQIRM